MDNDLIDPNFQATASEVRALRSQRRLVEAATLTQKFIDKFPQDLSWQMEFAVQHQIENRFDEALSILKNLSDNNQFPGQLEALLKALDLTILTKRFEDAALLIERVIAWYPNLIDWARGPGAYALVCARAAPLLLNCLNDPNLTLARLTTPEPAAGFESAGMIIMTKDEADILTHNLEHHYRIGFRHFFIADNKSSDATAQSIITFRETHPDVKICYFYDVVTSYYQAHKMAIFQNMFIEYMKIADINLKWMFFIDTDELLCCGDPAEQAALKDAMEDDTIDIIVFHWLVCASQTPLASTPSDKSPLYAYPMVKAVYPPASKVALRVGRGYLPTIGNHWLTGFTGPLESIRIMAEHKWYMFHYMIRSVDQMRRKVINGGLSLLNTKGMENHAGHWKVDYANWQERGDDYIIERVARHVDDVAREGVLLR